MTYYIKGGSRYNEANPTVWTALNLAGFADSKYLDVDWKQIDYESIIDAQDPFWLFGSISGGAKEAEFGLYNDYRIKFDVTGIYGWNGSSWTDILAMGGASNLGDLDDVVITAPADNELLAWDNGSSRWINQTAAEAGLAVTFGDVDSGTDFNSHSEQVKAGFHIIGGGTITVDGSYRVGWTQKMLVMNAGRGTHFSTSGFFQIDQPTSGVITAVGGGTANTWNASGIIISGWNSLYYILPIGSDHTSIAANFRMVGYTSDLEIPDDWILIAKKHHEGGGEHIKFGVGIQLNASETWVQGTASMIKYTNANAVAAVLAADDYVKIVGDTMTGELNMEHEVLRFDTNGYLIHQRSSGGYLKIWGTDSSTDDKYIECVNDGNLIIRGYHQLNLGTNEGGGITALTLTPSYIIAHKTLAMGANNITLNAAQTVDGVDISALSVTNMPTAINNWKMYATDGSGVMTELAVGAAGKVLTGNGVGAAPSFEDAAGGGDIFHSGYIHLQEQQASGVHGGTYTSGAYRTRDINTEITDIPNACSVGASQFTLDAGTYIIQVTVPAHDCHTHHAHLYNITDSAIELRGTNAFCHTSYAGTECSFINGTFTIVAQKTFEIQNRCTTTRATTGFGVSNSYGDIEVYTDIQLWKVA